MIGRVVEKLPRPESIAREPLESRQGKAMASSADEPGQEQIDCEQGIHPREVLS